ncbi:MAG: FG-GAP repeat protein [Bacteroidetes bacterium]|nr:FG-GAP repeat protein [Bacteroidota bacterium]
MTNFVRCAKSTTEHNSICGSIYLIVLMCLSSSVFAQGLAGRHAEQERLGRIAASHYAKLTNGDAVPPSPEKANVISGKFFNGQGNFDSFGNSVSSAGDVNGDGFDDIIVGAYGYTSPNFNKGRAYIYFGGPDMDNKADVTLDGEAALHYFGFSVSAAGDVNGDGYADVIVGAYGHSVYAGLANIFYGGATMDNIADKTLLGEAANNYFGQSVSTAGDVNGDGFSDVIVGAYGNTSSTGRAYIYYGGSNMNTAADVTMSGQAAFDQFGVSVSTAGDVNGDGYSDVIVGAFGNSSNAGRTYIYYGGAVMNNVADVTMSGEGANQYFGVSTSTAGDVNGDGYADVIIGAYSYGSSVGRAYLYFGGATMDNIVDVTMTGEASGVWFGVSVSTAGDLNGDGYSDVVVGAFGYANNSGRAYVYFGGLRMNNTADKTLTGETVSNFGYSVASAGDVNGDGYSELLVGGKGFNSGTGRVYLYQNSMTGIDVADERFTGEASGNTFGSSVASAGDVNGDDYSDIIVGAYTYSDTVGRAYIYYGGPTMDNIADVTLNGNAAYTWFGYSVSTAGDVNRDGYADVIVGMYNLHSNPGRAYIYFGGAAMNNTADVTLTGEGALDNFGLSVSTAGDMNGDGYSDVIVGAEGFYFGYGKAYVYYGGANMNNTADVTMGGSMEKEYFGTPVSAAGDVNGDGFGDVIIGGAGYFHKTGQAYIFYGGANLGVGSFNNNINADIKFTGKDSLTYFGGSASTAGDVNGDGYSDVIVADYKDNGRAIIYYGAPAMNNTADVILAVEGSLMYSVSAAGDVNNDGYADVIAGTTSDVSGIKGRASIFFGGTNMNNTADVVMTGESISDSYGMSVATAGDVNGDGNADVIVGAPSYSTPNSGYIGRAYLYRSTAPSIVPRITAVADVPHDQGGVVNVQWSRSGYDVRNISRVTSYRLEQSDPPGKNGFAWSTVATIQASHNPQYAQLVSTPYDSMTATGGSFFYRVTAATDDNDEYWRSGIVAGHSIDNLPPISPTSAALAVQPNGNILLSWNQNRTDGDVGGYTIYRSTTAGFAPSMANAITITRDSSYLDITGTVGIQYFYRIKAVDIHGNESAPSPELSTAPLAVGRTDAPAPTEYTLDQNYPNPFNPVTNISFAIPADGSVSLKVYDALGRNVETLINEYRTAGRYTVPFSAGRLSSGLYVCEIRAENFVKRIKMNLLK